MHRNMKGASVRYIILKNYIITRHITCLFLPLIQSDSDEMSASTNTEHRMFTYTHDITENLHNNDKGTAIYYWWYRYNFVATTEIIDEKLGNSFG